MPVESEIAGGTSGAQSEPEATNRPYTDEQWDRVRSTLPTGAPEDARDQLQKLVVDFLEMPTIAELREQLGDYLSDVSMIESSLRALDAAISMSSIRILSSLRAHLGSAMAEAEKMRLQLERDMPGPKEKEGEPWPVFLDRLCSRWHRWTGDLPGIGRRDGQEADGPAVRFVLAAAEPVHSFRKPRPAKPMTPEMSAYAIRKYRKKAR